MAGMIGRGLRGDSRGVSDVLTIAFMFLIVIFAGVLLNGYRFGIISSAADRQLQLKTEYLYKTLELSQVENYSISYFESVSENLVQITPQVVPSDYLHERIENAIAYLRPPGYAVEVKLTHENTLWQQIYPGDAGAPGENTEKFTFSGKVTLILAGATEQRVVQVNASVTIFKY